MSSIFPTSKPVPESMVDHEPVPEPMPNSELETQENPPENSNSALENVRFNKEKVFPRKKTAASEFA